MPDNGEGFCSPGERSDTRDECPAYRSTHAGYKAVP
ncbi:hypothetical protein J2R80_004945 [Bradyrhizobium sp. USDA 4541]|nr:hypothetical protein [Bradyrhizobium sp. USDA 4541]